MNVDECLVFEDSSSESEPEESKYPRGVKKATVGRPRNGRIKSIAEKFKKKATARRRLSMKDSSHIRVSEMQQEIAGETLIATAIQTQESQTLSESDIYNGTPYLHDNMDNSQAGSCDPFNNNL